ncbi:hypothetical protein [Neptunicella sp. SCSIO 80796]|uniref:hypothetical protein n=1 Tax=Neptunicella plasticusilytica TaxID=3117012 RepID=UPI003A4E20B8
MRQLLLLLLLFPVTAISAAFHLNDDSPLLYAKEALTAKDIKGEGQLTISSATDILNITVRAGFSLSSSAKYARLDVINGTFNNAFPASGFAASGSYSSSTAQGGAIGDSSIIVQISAPNVIGPETEFTLESSSFTWLDISEPLKIQYTLYDSPAAAVNGGAYIARTTAPIAQVISAIGDSYTQSFTHSATFSQDFLRFKTTFRSPSVFALGDATEKLASMGKVRFDNLIVADVRFADTSLLINSFADLLPNLNTKAPNASIRGDFSSVRAFLNDQADCTGTSLDLLEYSAEEEVKVSIDNLINYPVFCLAAQSDEIPLQRSAYQLDLGIGLESKLLGEIVYDAASIDLPYLTSYVDYRQRIILVNHAGYDVAYTTRFSAEDDVVDHYTVQSGANGTIPAGGTLKMNTEELVTIDKAVPSRVSARIYVDAKPADISAAIQILSLESNLPPQTNVLQVLP